MDIDAFRKRVITAIEKFKENGGTLVTGDWQTKWDPEIHQWVSPNHCACALGCLLLIEQATSAPNRFNDSDGIVRNIASTLDLGIESMLRFVDGFEGRAREFSNVDAMYELGKEIRMKYSPVYFDDFMNGPEEDEEDYDYGRDPEPTDDYGLN